MKWTPLDPFNALVHRCSLKTLGKGALEGWKFVVKNNYAVKGLPLTCASKSLQNYEASYTADVVNALLEADGELIGCTNLDEYGMGSRCDRSIFGPTVNPLDSTKSPGGSSGGNAAVIASGMARIAIGSDTGGSCRLPASYTGIVGFKPSWGVLSRFGLVSYAPSLDCVGLMGRSGKDLATAFEECLKRTPRGQKDGNDSTLRDLPSNERSSLDPIPLEGLIIGIPQEWLAALQDHAPNSRAILSKVLDFLDDSGCRMKLLSIPELKDCLEHYYAIASMEASSTLARYSGLFFGAKAQKIEEEQERQMGQVSYWHANASFTTHVHQYQSEMFGQEVQRRVEVGRGLLSQPSQFERSQAYRQSLKMAFQKVYQEECCDLIVGPTALTSASVLNSPLCEMEDFFTVSANLTGLPAISLPLHPSGSGTSGVIGTQFMAGLFQDRFLLRVAQELEKKFFDVK